MINKGDQQHAFEKTLLIRLYWCKSSHRRNCHHYAHTRAEIYPMPRTDEDTTLVLRPLKSSEAGSGKGLYLYSKEAKNADRNGCGIRVLIICINRRQNYFGSVLHGFHNVIDYVYNGFKLVLAEVFFVLGHIILNLCHFSQCKILKTGCMLHFFVAISCSMKSLYRSMIYCFM